MAPDVSRRYWFAAKRYVRALDRLKTVLADLPGERLEGPHLDEAAGPPLGGRLGTQPVQQPECLRDGAAFDVVDGLTLS